MIKRSSTTGKPWAIMDNKRLGYNVDNNASAADSNAADATTDLIDIVSNGFKCRTTNSYC